LVDGFTPRTVAPNAITLSGLALMFAAYCAVWYHCPNYDEGAREEEGGGTGGSSTPSVPRWIFAFNCAAMLAYQTLDNMDGKQARRTGSSSPLGLLFDHGCDAVNSAFGSGNWMAAMAVSTSSDPLAAWALVFMPMAAFYVTTWEEYHTGEMVLPSFNGPTEGLLMGAALSMTSAVLGPAYWRGTDWYDVAIAPVATYLLPPSVADGLMPEGGIRNCDLVALASVLGFVVAFFPRIYENCRRYGASTLAGLFPFAVLCGAPLVVGRADPDLFVRNPRTSLHLFSGLFAEMATQLMLDHMTLLPFRALRPVLFPLAALATARAAGAAPGGDEADAMLLAYAVGVWVYLAMKVSVVIHEICDALGIWCFDIVTPREKGSGGKGGKELKVS